MTLWVQFFQVLQTMIHSVPFPTLHKAYMWIVQLLMRTVLMPSGLSVDKPKMRLSEKEVPVSHMETERISFCPVPTGILPQIFQTLITERQ